ncbi:hypothetical protein C8_109 [Cannes 8 virus]|uniref:hypothetical protein n=1 Tax=Melbournevirus TaxID=1560514 RepID=UPI000392B28B|nr:hypothetical protein MEL_092 [Melbournevirus]AGV01458.1 hypothetical protein C8_109 [Cannes 8 virus]AIT54705.1 hypothetical protein MEL_092 [Melbournevirus]
MESEVLPKVLDFLRKEFLLEAEGKTVFEGNEEFSIGVSCSDFSYFWTESTFTDDVYFPQFFIGSLSFYSDQAEEALETIKQKILKKNPVHAKYAKKIKGILREKSELKRKCSKLQEKYDMLKGSIKYAPGSAEYDKAKEEFHTLQNSF